MTAFTQVPSLVTFTPLTTILSADVNANYAAIRNVVNGLVSGSNTIAVDTITENTAANGIATNKKFTVSGGVLTVASGVAITGGVVSGIATFSSGIAFTGGVVSGIATFSSGFAITGGVVSGVATFSSAFAVTGGVPTFASGFTVTNVATFTSGITVSGGVSRFAVGTAATTAKPVLVLAATKGFTISTTEQSITSVTLAANAVAADGTQLRVTARGFSQDATSWNLKWVLGATTIMSATQTASGAFERSFVVTRTAATTIAFNGSLLNGATVSVTQSTLTTGLNFAADQLMDLRGIVSTTANFLVVNSYAVEVIAQ